MDFFDIAISSCVIIGIILFFWYKHLNNKIIKNYEEELMEQEREIRYNLQVIESFRKQRNELLIELEKLTKENKKINAVNKRYKTLMKKKK